MRYRHSHGPADGEGSGMTCDGYPLMMRCWATSKTGNQCKRKVRVWNDESDGRCHVHRPKPEGMPLAVDVNGRLAYLMLSTCAERADVPDAEVGKLLRLRATIATAEKNGQRVEARLTVTIET